MGTRGQFIHVLNINEYNRYLEKKSECIEMAKKEGYKDKKDDIRQPFFIIYCSFISELKHITNGALKLYLYCGFNMDYKYGYLQFSYDQIAKELHITKRCAYKWVKELKELGLIFDVKENRNKQYLFLSPYGNNISYDLDDTKEILIGKYRTWINTKKQESYPFCFINKSFMNYWDQLKLATIKLYLYCNICMDKKLGYFYKSIDTISKELNVSKKTVSNGFAELQAYKLIERHQRSFNGSSCTHIMPLIESRIKKIKIKKFYGYKFISLKVYKY